ncbi:UDP-N-acetylenolpyruvoylglucosamine reductase, partial [Candidatus Jorgensenbacteria bacterium CG11_big_fil_rev_8_21_14_0_20_38_23]
YKNKECRFGYRDSIFKKRKDLIIISITLQLKKGKKKEIGNIMKEYLEYKKKTQPLNFPSAGSVFKNPKGFFA